MADQSNFSRFPKKQLVFIASKIVDDGFDWQSLDNDYANEYEDCEKILQSASSYFNESVVEEDVQFFAKFLEINDDLLSEIFESNDKTLIEQLVIPQSTDYLVEYTSQGSCTFIEYYQDRSSSYDKNWVSSSIYTQYHSGEWDLWSGELKNTEYDNFESNEWEIDEIKEIGNTQESRNPRKLLENTLTNIIPISKKLNLENNIYIKSYI
jgi:hypothetical protein